MIDYPAALAVAMVAQTGSFEKAAKALHLTSSAVSQRVKAIEERLGAALIARGTPCVATEKGEWLCRHVEQVGLLERELVRSLPGLAEDGPSRRTTLNLATNADSLGTWFLEPAAAFAQAGDFLLNIAVDDEEHTAEWLRKGKVSAAVTSRAKPAPGCRVAALGALRYHATASPAFVARRFPQGVTLAALSEAPALTFNQKDRLQQSWILQAFGEDASFPTHWLPSTQGFVEASLAGMGWGLNPAPLVEAHLASGRLVELIPGEALDVPLYWQANRLAADRLADLTRAVLRAARKALIQPQAIAPG